MSSPERIVAHIRPCTPISTAPARRPSPGSVSSELVLAALPVPALLELRREAHADLSRLSERPPADLPFAIRARTRALQREAAATVTERLARIEHALQHRGALPAPDDDGLRALPAWIGAWRSPPPPVRRVDVA